MKAGSSVGDAIGVESDDGVAQSGSEGVAVANGADVAGVDTQAAATQSAITPRGKSDGRTFSMLACYIARHGASVTIGSQIRIRGEFDVGLGRGAAFAQTQHGDQAETGGVEKQHGHEVRRQSQRDPGRVQGV